ncbi:MAG: cyclic nucleotide-binding domain-containing protein, partial [Hymenobacteraceae bacterium]|nr:cyclic nucleotide-binding domain-containing protein [Hymenobacteraceae bacterium]
MSDTRLLKALLLQATAMSEAETDSFLSLWMKTVRLKRNDFLIQKGKTEQYLYFVNSGALRIYYPTELEEICVGFAYDNTLVCSFPSFVDNKPSEYAIQALKKCELIAIHKTDFQRFLNENLKFEQFWRQQLEKVILGRIDREIDLLLPEPEKRLQRLLNRSPHIFQLVPKKYIASY